MFSPKLSILLLAIGLFCSFPEPINARPSDGHPKECMSTIWSTAASRCGVEECEPSFREWTETRCLQQHDEWEMAEACCPSKIIHIDQVMVPRF